MATGPKPSNVGLPQKIQDPEKLQRALYALLQKADVQSKIVNNWHRKARLETAHMEAENRKQDTKVGAVAAASLRACQIQLAVARSQDDITIPGCRFIPKTR